MSRRGLSEVQFLEETRKIEEEVSRSESDFEKNNESEDEGYVPPQKFK